MKSTRQGEIPCRNDTTLQKCFSVRPQAGVYANSSPINLISYCICFQHFSIQDTPNSITQKYGTPIGEDPDL